MSQLTKKLISKIYKFVKSNEYFSNQYYSVANSSYFENFLEHEKMLSDKNRMSAYHKAISKYVKEGDTVIDLGTGTGILSFFAAQNSAKKIYAIEHGNIIETAKKIAEHNRFNNIEFVNKNSKEFTINEKADFIIHEQIGALLFDENMIDNIYDLKERVLKKGGKIIPGKFEVFLAPVKLKELSKVPYLWEQELYGVNYNCFDELKNKEIDPAYGILKVRPEAVEYFLSEPVKILYLDMETMNKEDLRNEFDINVEVNRAGLSDGFCFFFNIIFDDENILSTNPLNSVTHWNVPVLRTENKYYQKGDEIKFSLSWKNPSKAETYNWNILN